MPGQRTGFTTRASCLLAAGGTALACGLLLGIVDLARAGVLALAVPLISSLVVVRSRVRIANRRSIEPARATSGDTVVVQLTMTNRSLIPTGALMLEDQLPPQFSGRARFVLDGLLGRESRTVSYRMPRLPRGRYRTGPLHLRLTDPFHLVDVRRSFTATTEVLITPRIDPLPGDEPPRSIDIGDDAGSHSIGARGADDVSTREYRTGDDLRKIHWRSSARTGVLQVRQEERPWQGQLSLLLDLRLGAHVQEAVEARREDGDERQQSSLEWAISAAASIGTHALVAGRTLDLLCDPTAAAPARMSQASQLAGYLATVQGSSNPNLSPFAGSLRSLSQESTVIAVLGDVDPASLSVLSQVHPRGSSRTAMALLIDSATWHDGPEAYRGSGATARVPSSHVATAAQVLQAAGWQTAIVRCGQPIAQAWRTVSTTDGASSRTVAMLR
ncbi:DUF58 domain-containing protein [Jatrophihabitans sp.]|uniref:DUF58 domain-containing protein n=1 Tax=Jatrophihabitans sp. TaxID=1932789 RepID=UPI0030C6D385|nr:Conserved repeat protein [Jatrophihabitans sp.]